MRALSIFIGIMQLVQAILKLPRLTVSHLRKYHMTVHKYLNGFLIGMMCEYIHRVEVSPYPIVLICILLIEIIIVETDGHKD